MKKLTTIVETRKVEIEEIEGNVELVGAISKDDTVYIPLRQFCDHLSIDWSSQRRRTNRHGFYSDHVASVSMEASDGRMRDQLCLPLDFIHGWLLGIDPNRVGSPETAKKLKAFQAVAHKFLYAAFSPMSEPSTEAKLMISLNLIPKVMEHQINLGKDIEVLRIQMEHMRTEIKILKQGKND
ncbi:MAG: phage antirepressor N-terminal domain-containing protein [Chloroflexota bacterium]